MNLENERYNIVVVGGGAAGLVSAYLAAAAKAKVALVCEGPMGGDCLNTGCVPSKALLASAKVAHTLRKSGSFGMTDVSYSVDFKVVMQRVREKIAQIEPHDSRERYTSLGVECFDDRVTMVEPGRVTLASGAVLRTKNIIMATGARAFVPSIPGLDEVKYLTSENIWDLEELPKQLVIVGGGAIGCELAQAFARLGSDVSLVENKEHLFADERISREMKTSLELDGVNVVLDNVVESVHEGYVVLQGAQKTLNYTHLFVATGRRPNTDLVDYEINGMSCSDWGGIAVDPHLAATSSGIYACGDVLGHHQLTHAASHEAYYCVANALSRPFFKQKVDYSVIPSVVYTDPEFARVGKNEQDLEESDYDTYEYQFKDLDRAVVDDNTAGFVRVRCSAGSDRVVGVDIVGANAGELISYWALAMKNKVGLGKILGTVHAYPTMSEANQRVAGVWKKASTSSKLIEMSEKINRFRRR